MVLLLSFLTRKFEPLIIACRLLVGNHLAVGCIMEILDRITALVRYPSRTTQVVGMVVMLKNAVSAIVPPNNNHHVNFVPRSNVSQP